MIVELVVKGGAGDLAGLRSGDLLLSWTRESTSPANPERGAGALLSPFDLEALETEQAPRGPLVLEGLRDGAPFSVPVPLGDWLVEARPRLTAELLASYEQGLALVAAGSLAEGTAAWLDLAERDGQARELAAWLLARCERSWLKHREWPGEMRAVALAARLDLRDRPRLLATLDGLRAASLYEQRRWEEAEQAYARQQARLEVLDAARLALAAALVSRGANLQWLARTDEQLALLQRALELREHEAPGSLAVADSERRLARLLSRADPQRAETLAEQAAQLVERLAPRSLTAARVHYDVASTLALRGSIEKAERHLRLAVPLFERLLPASLPHVVALNELAAMRLRLSDPAGAEELLEYSVQLARAARLHSDLLGDIYSRQAAAAELRGDEPAAYRASLLALAEAERGGRPDARMAVALGNVADAELRMGRLDAAEPRVRRALEILKPVSEIPEYEAHEASLRRSDGAVALARSDLPRAREACERALALHRGLAADLADEALDHLCLARVERAAGDAARALDHHADALAVLVAARERLAGDAGRGARAVAPYADVYSEYVAALADAGRPAAALEVLEGSRARGLLEQLGERQLFDDAGLSPDLASERASVEADYVGARSALRRLRRGPEQPEQRELLLARAQLEELRRRLEDVADRVRQEAPRLAALQYPRPLGYGGVRAALDPGTLLLAYAVGERQTVLFAVEPEAVGEPGVHVFRLPVGRAELRRRADAFRSLARSPLDPERRRALDEQAGELFEALLRPAWKLAQRAERLLLSPDDALLALPFPALRVGRRYLAELKPLHVTVSATVYAQVRAARPPARRTGRDPAVVFGAPLYPSSAAAMHTRGGAALRDLQSLSALPSARAEAEDVAAVLGRRATLYLGQDATEARVRELPPETSIVHFASHAFTDEQRPMQSALVLTASDPSGDQADSDGLLEAWEIASHLRLGASLVTLSACETALGAPVAGEGLIGLTRAFLHAGARAVLGSLWRVEDDSTRVLMARFYRELRGGRSTDEALRRAQVALLRGRWRDPVHWAAFQLQGDWR